MSVLMILPLTASFHYKTEEIPAIDLSQGEEFNTLRKRIDLRESSPLSQNQLSQICANLLMEYRKELPRLPLYIVLNDGQIELIRDLSRIGALAYLGEWSEKSEEESAKDWEKITEALRSLENGNENKRN